MSGSKANGSSKSARSGAQTLALIAAPLSFQILRALESGPQRQLDLQRACGMPPQTTLRARLKEFAEAGAVERRPHTALSRTLDYELNRAGRELLAVAAVLECWLARSSEGPLELGGTPAKAAIGALAEGWSTCMLRALAAKPRTLTELDGVIPSLNYPSLARRLSAMRLAGQIEPGPNVGHGTPYGITDWGRAAIAPLSAAARWERHHAPDRSPPIGKVDAEAAFLMAVPLLRLPAELSGACRMTTDLTDGEGRSLAGVVVETRSGKIASCTTQLRGSPDAWATGSAAAWLAAVIDGDGDNLEVGGYGALAHALLGGLHGALFSSPR